MKHIIFSETTQQTPSFTQFSCNRFSVTTGPDIGLKNWPCLNCARIWQEPRARNAFLEQSVAPVLPLCATQRPAPEEAKIWLGSEICHATQTCSQKLAHIKQCVCKVGLSKVGMIYLPWKSLNYCNLSSVIRKMAADMWHFLFYSLPCFSTSSYLPTIMHGIF